MNRLNKRRQEVKAVELLRSLNSLRTKIDKPVLVHMTSYLKQINMYPLQLQVLKEQAIVSSTKEGQKCVYQWIGIKPNIYMAREIIDVLTKRTKKKQEESKPKPIERISKIEQVKEDDIKEIKVVEEQIIKPVFEEVEKLEVKPNELVRKEVSYLWGIFKVITTYTYDNQ